MAAPAKFVTLPPTEAELIGRIRNFVSDALDCPVEKVGPDDHLYETLHLDSLGAMAVFIDLSYQFGIPEPNPGLDFSSFYTVRLLAHYARSFEGNRPLMTRNDLIERLPYGESFLFIDEAQHLGERHITSRFAWTGDRPEIAAHFLHGPKLVPGVLLAEQVAQSALLLAILEGYRPSREPMTLAQFRCEIVAPAPAPCTVVAMVEVDAIAGEAMGFRGTCSVDGQLVAKVRGIAAASMSTSRSQ
jgi:acyl carrier protein/3-hydroxymyristoyl/3-hydroxydecanoyl-(acyl carrier protein) dehydratase